MNIVMLIDAWFPFVGGGQIHVQKLSQALEKNHPVEVKIFSTPFSHILLRGLWSLYVIPQVIIYSLTHQLDIIHSHAYIAGLPAKILSSILRKPVVHTVHGSSSLDQQLNTVKAKLERFLLTQIHYSAEITVSSNFLKHQNINSTIEIIPNGIDLSEFDIKKPKKYTQPTLIFVGRKNDPVKGYKYLEQAIAVLKQKIPNLKANIISDLPRNKIISEYYKSHVFTLPSLAEGQPITLLEAWAAQLPVVVTAVGDNPNMVVDDKNGYLVMPRDPNQLADKIHHLLTHKKIAQKLGKTGRKLVESKYTWKRAALSTYKLYQNLLK